MSFNIKFIRLDQKHVGLARQASPFLRCFWSRLINLISKDTNMVFSITSWSKHKLFVLVSLTEFDCQSYHNRNNRTPVSSNSLNFDLHYILPSSSVLTISDSFLVHSKYSTRPQGYEKISCSTQLSMELFLLINVKMPTTVGILTFISRKNSILGLYDPEKC